MRWWAGKPLGELSFHHEVLAEKKERTLCRCVTIGMYP
jgi:hypothetical protein